MNEQEKRQQIEKAVTFLTDKLSNEARELTKPVICHSLRVGFYLYDRGYKTEIILAGFLHDLLEDTDTGLEEIVDLFGRRVAMLVDANSKRAAQEEKTAQMIDRCVKAGEDALIIKTADILENYEYGIKQNWQPAIKYFPKSCQLILDKKPDSFADPIFDELKSKHSELANG